MKSKISHRDVMNRICDDLELSSNSRRCAEIKKHLKECRDCTAYLDSVRKTITLYRNYPPPKPTKAAKKKLYAIIPLR